MNSGSIYIETYGCQMNLADSEIVLALLEEHGYQRADSPNQAGIILINTCAVREHAQEKAITNISQYRKYKEANHAVRIGVLGCLSKYMGEVLAERLPFLDWILGPDAYRALPALLLDSAKGGSVSLRACDSVSLRACDSVNLYENANTKSYATKIVLNGAEEELYDEILPSRRDAVNAWITISRGCDNHCTYCVVPSARGSERSRPAPSILREVRQTVIEGFPQVTLLGQNVNSYRYENVDFPRLLTEVSNVPGVKRIRFLTSHPKDCSTELLKIIGKGLPFCPELHLPIQSGSDRILERMGRNYTADHYRKLVDQARELVRDLLLSTDIIVGFPSETEADFRETERLVSEIGFDDAFIYRYSERPGTPAASLPDDVPNEEKIRRLMILNDIVRKSGARRRLSLIGRTLPVLVESRSKKNPDEMMGRTPAGQVVVFPGNQSPGTEVRVRLAKLSGFTLRGKVV